MLFLSRIEYWIFRKEKEKIQKQNKKGKNKSNYYSFLYLTTPLM